MCRRDLNRNTRLSFYLLVVGFVTAIPAQAADGVLEINQTCATQSGCFTGDNAGFPVSITQPGSYILTSNLLVADDLTAIIVDTANTGARIDLNGFEIVGPVECTGTGADVVCTGDNESIAGIFNGAANKGTSVRNGTVRGFRFGIALRDQVFVTEVTAIGNAQVGITLLQGTVTNCRAVNNGGAGFGAGAGTLMERNTSLQNAGQGFFAGVGSQFTANIARLNGLSGINAGAGSTVIGNTAYDNDGFGLVLGAGSGYSENVLYSNNGTINDPQISGTGIQMGINSCGNGVCP